MELILAILEAGPMSYFTSSCKQGLVRYLVAWAIVFPIQTVVVSSDSGLDPSYWAVNALILASGIGLNRFGSIRGESRPARRSVPRGNLKATAPAPSPMWANRITGWRMPI